MKKPIYKILYAQVIFAIVVGIILGYFFPSQKDVIVNGVETDIPGLGEMMKPLGDGFIRLIKMVIAPIIFCTVVSGIAGMKDMKSVGKTGGYALLYFEVVSTIALIVGLVIINVFQPGAGMDIDLSTYASSKAEVAKYTVAAEGQGVVATLLGIIPNSVVGAFADGNILQVLLFAILFAFALHRLGSYGRPMLKFIEQVAQVFFNIIGFIMHLAPIGAFGAMAFTIGKYGLGTLWQLGSLMLCFYATCLLFVFGVLGAIAKFHGFNIFRVLAYIKEELLIVLGTSSSESVLPRMMKKMEDVGCEKSVVGLVIPTGYSFNLDGTSIYLTMAAIFLAQATNTSMTIWQQLALLAVLFISSKGAAGVTGSGFIVLAATLSAVGSIPVASIAIILGIDRFMSEARALTNLCGNAVATIVVAKWCNQLDEERLDQVLSKKDIAEVPEAV